MTNLTAVSEVEVSTLRDVLGVNDSVMSRNDSVMSRHVAALATIDYVKSPGSRKGVQIGRRTTWISLTTTGRRALTKHVAALRELIADVE